MLIYRCTDKFCACYNVNCLVAVSLFAALALFCLFISFYRLFFWMQIKINYYLILLLLLLFGQITCIQCLLLNTICNLFNCFNCLHGLATIIFTMFANMEQQSNYLSSLLSNSLTFQPHIKMLSYKLEKAVGILNKVKTYPNKPTLLSLYSTRLSFILNFTMDYSFAA